MFQEEKCKNIFSKKLKVGRIKCCGMKTNCWGKKRSRKLIIVILSFFLPFNVINTSQLVTDFDLKLLHALSNGYEKSIEDKVKKF